MLIVKALNPRLSSQLDTLCSFLKESGLIFILEFWEVYLLLKEVDNMVCIIMTIPI